jgi:hypothetical protein
MLIVTHERLCLNVRKQMEGKPEEEILKAIDVALKEQDAAQAKAAEEYTASRGGSDE